MIRLGQRRRFKGPDRPFAYYNHAGMIVGSHGEIVEAQPKGVVERNISAYQPRQYTVVRTGAVADDRDRSQMVAYACAAVGQRYDWLAMVGAAIQLATGNKLVLATSDKTICSGLVARGLDHSSFIFLTNPAAILPGDLAKLFDVRPPT
jgi:hypothetical protein